MKTAQDILKKHLLESAFIDADTEDIKKEKWDSFTYKFPFFESAMKEYARASVNADRVKIAKALNNSVKENVDVLDVLLSIPISIK